MGYERPLRNLELIEHFMHTCLPAGAVYKDKNEKVLSPEQIFGKIEDAESLAKEAGCTHREMSRRLAQYRSDEERAKLHAKVVEELVEMQRLDNDEDIKLGDGGAKPLGDVKTDKQAYLITGLPASGKSSIAAKICDAHGAYLIDPDFAKRKIPEFDKTIAGASRVHTESMQIALGIEKKGPNLLAACLSLGVNIVRPLIGDDQEKLDIFCEMLKKNGYAVHLILVDLDRKEACARALKRFLQTERYVSLPYIFDECANDAALVYYRYRASPTVNTEKSMWASFGAISTSAKQPARVDMIGKGNPVELFPGD